MPELDFRAGVVLLLEGGITQRPSPIDTSATMQADTRYGTIIRWKLTPQERMATISEFCAILDVNRITVRNTTIGLYMFMKYGMKFR